MFLAGSCRSGGKGEIGVCRLWAESGTLIHPPQLPRMYTILKSLVLIPTFTAPAPSASLLFPQAKFPAIAADPDALEPQVRSICTSYLEGLAWALAYYTRGPAAVDWSSPSSSGSKRGTQGGGGREEVAGASWTWCYPHHYAPLMAVSDH